MNARTSSSLRSAATRLWGTSGRKLWTLSHHHHHHHLLSVCDYKCVRACVCVSAFAGAQERERERERERVSENYWYWPLTRLSLHHESVLSPPLPLRLVSSSANVNWCMRRFTNFRFWTTFEAASTAVCASKDRLTCWSQSRWSFSAAPKILFFRGPNFFLLLFAVGFLAGPAAK